MLNFRTYNIMIELTPIPVGFELERFGSASIDLHEWMRLRNYALEFVVGKGVNATSFTVLHTEAGFADLASHTQVRWLADHFELLCAAGTSGDVTGGFLAELNRLILPMPSLQFVLCAAAASTLLAYLRITEKLPADCFGVSLVGTSSTGKTTALKLAASLYSTPDDENVFTAFYGTANALHSMLGKHHGVPIAYDESTIHNAISISNFIYAFTQGQEKLRLDSNAQLKCRNNWACTALFSSENYLVNAERDNLGIIARVITLDGLTYTVDGVHSEQIKAFTGKNYGYVGSLLAEHLLASDSAEILQQFQDVREELLELFPETCSLSERLAMNYAMIITTSVMLSTLGIQTNTEILKQMCVLLHGEITEEAHPGKNLVCRIFNYISCSYKMLEGIKWTLDREKKPIKVEILESTFEQILEQIGAADKKPQFVVFWMKDTCSRRKKTVSRQRSASTALSATATGFAIRRSMKPLVR